MNTGGLMNVIIIGAGGHARVVHEILMHDNNMDVVAFVDNKQTSGEKIMGTSVLGGHSVIPLLIKDGVQGAIIAIGDNVLRANRFVEMDDFGLVVINAVHPTAHIAYNARIGNGVVIATGATLATGVEIGDNVVINTGATIEHENIIKDHVHVAPGSILAGRVIVEEGSFIGAGSVVKEGITIGKNVTIGAGSVVLEDIVDNAVAVGAPAKIIKIKN